MLNNNVTSAHVAAVEEVSLVGSFINDGLEFSADRHYVYKGAKAGILSKPSFVKMEDSAIDELVSYLQSEEYQPN